MIVDKEKLRVSCELCGSLRTKKLIGTPSFRVTKDSATPRIEKRVKDYLVDGKWSSLKKQRGLPTSCTRRQESRRALVQILNISCLIKGNKGNTQEYKGFGAYRSVIQEMLAGCCPEWRVLDSCYCI